MRKHYSHFHPIVSHSSASRRFLDSLIQFAKSCVGLHDRFHDDQNARNRILLFFLSASAAQKILDREVCPLSAAQLIEAYHLEHEDGLKNDQRRTLYFHAGQLYAFNNNFDIAIHHFEKSINPSENYHAELSWNAYVRANIAFLKKDKNTLLAQRERMKRSNENSANQLNEAVVDRLIHCFDRSYKDAYARGCE